MKKSRSYLLATMIVSAASLLTLPALAAEPVVVNVDNFARAETALQFDRTLEYVNGAVNTLLHIRVSPGRRLPAHCPRCTGRRILRLSVFTTRMAIFRKTNTTHIV